jgi:outer membrane lipoprotein-sorting protein
MARPEIEDMDQLNDVWDALVREESLADTDAGIAATVHRVAALDASVPPGAVFVRRLGERLATTATTDRLTRPNRHAAYGIARRWVTSSRLVRWPLASTAAAVLVLGLAGLVLVIQRPGSVRAEEIVRKAQAAATDAAASGVDSFEMVEETVTMTNWGLSPDQRAQGASGQSRSVRQVWFREPDHWRNELRFTELPRQSPDSAPRVTVADGQTIWSYDPRGNALQISLGQLGVQTAKGDYGLYGASNLDAMVQRASECYQPRLEGQDSVAGRPAYVVNMGPSNCPSAAAAEANGPLALWLDRETFFVLKAVLRDTTGTQVVQTRQVTSILYNRELPDALFAFATPSGATVLDNRPKPAPTTVEFEQQLAALAKQVEFPVFVPRSVPGGLVPRQPRLDSLGLQLEYVPSDNSATDTPAQQRGFTIIERRATSAEVASATNKAEPLVAPVGNMWLRRGAASANSAAIVLRNGTLISVASLGVAPDALVTVASSLAPVPGGHAPLPEPTAPGLDAIRGRFASPVFVPTWLPEPLSPEPPVAGEGRGGTVGLTYHTSDGSLALMALSGAAGCCLDNDPRKAGQAVALPNGLTAHYLNLEPAYGGPILWWEQEGAYVALSGPRRTRDELVKIAASMSKTADLGRVELVRVRPTPTPVPPPTFPILRPNWLPEAMSVQEEDRQLSTPDGPASSVWLHFDATSTADSRDALQLLERPKDSAPDRQNVPGTIHETIGGHDVTIGRRGENCMNASWVQGEIALTLLNSYDGVDHVRYSCDVVRKVVESVR